MDQEVPIRHILRSNYAELRNDYAHVTHVTHVTQCYAVLRSITQNYAHCNLLMVLLHIKRIATSSHNTTVQV